MQNNMMEFKRTFLFLFSPLLCDCTIAAFLFSLWPQLEFCWFLIGDCLHINNFLLFCLLQRGNVMEQLSLSQANDKSMYVNAGCSAQHNYRNTKTIANTMHLYYTNTSIAASNSSIKIKTKNLAHNLLAFSRCEAANLFK